MSEAFTWTGIALCLVHSGMFSGLNLALLGLSRLRLEVEAETGNRSAARILALRQDSNYLLTTIHTRLLMIFGRLGGSNILPTDTAYLELVDIFGGASQTKANMDAALGRQISKAEELFGVGTVVTTGDVKKARAL